MHKLKFSETKLKHGICSSNAGTDTQQIKTTTKKCFGEQRIKLNIIKLLVCLIVSVIPKIVPKIP